MHLLLRKGKFSVNKSKGNYNRREFKIRVAAGNGSRVVVTHFRIFINLFF